MLNALTIDVEDYWSILSRDWLHIEAEPSEAVVKNTEWFLQTLAEHNTKATFFILGEVAKKFPSLIKKIAQNGHEIGVHGFIHKQIFKLSKDEFRREVTDCKKLLEDITSNRVVGHRAPAFSIMPDTKWALEVLAQEGFKYDSSVFPISSKRYGWPGFSKDICKLELPDGNSIIEVPMSTVTILGKTLPVAGGGYIRHFPYLVTKLAIKHIQKTRLVIVYMHPYEIDTDSKVFETNYLSDEDQNRAIQFHKMQLRNRKTVANKLIRLLTEFRFTSLSAVIDTSKNYASILLTE
jgi:polysaccharide deacetylase family protein (PEP-CTERM system associated)